MERLVASTYIAFSTTNMPVPQRSKIERAAVGALKKMKVKIECRWFDYGSDDGDECVRLILFRDDIEITVGSYTVNAQSGRMPMNGLFVRTPRGERCWHWDDVRAWFAGRSLPPLKGA